MSRALPLLSRTAFVVKDVTRESLFIHRSTRCSEKIGLRLVLTSHRQVSQGKISSSTLIDKTAILAAVPVFLKVAYDDKGRAKTIPMSKLVEETARAYLDALPNSDEILDTSDVEALLTAYEYAMARDLPLASIRPHIDAVRELLSGNPKPQAQPGQTPLPDCEPKRESGGREQLEKMLRCETPVDEASWMANWLRGTIVIPDEVKLRIKFRETIAKAEMEVERSDDSR